VRAWAPAHADSPLAAGMIEEQFICCGMVDSGMADITDAKGEVVFVLQRGGEPCVALHDAAVFYFCGDVKYHILHPDMGETGASIKSVGLGFWFCKWLPRRLCFDADALRQNPPLQSFANT